MSTIITILIIAIIAALVIVGLKETIKHSKGEGACCGGGAMKEDEEATDKCTKYAPHQNSGSILLNAKSVSACIICQSVAQLIVPVPCINTACNH